MTSARISGTLPHSIDGLERLEWWELEDTRLSGTLPHAVRAQYHG